MPQLSHTQKNAVAFVAIGALMFGSVFFQGELLLSLRLILEQDYLRNVIVASTLTIVITHFVMVGGPGEGEGYMFKGQFFLLDIFLTCGTYIAVAFTACSLLEGAVIQQFFGDLTYFTKFSDVDIYVLLGVSALLLYYVLFNMYLLARDLTTSTSEVKKA